MPASICVKHNKPYPCGPCRKESALRPAQVAPLPLGQLEPTAAEVRVIAEDFTLSTVYPSRGMKDELGRPAQPKRVDSPWARAGAKKRKEEKNRRPPTAREQFSLTRRDVAALLDLEGVASSVKPFEATHLRDVAAGNVSTTELAERLRLSGTSAEVLITGWETAVIRKALLLGAKLKPVAAPADGQNDAANLLTDDQDNEMVDRDLRGYGDDVEDGGDTPHSDRD